MAQSKSKQKALAYVAYKPRTAHQVRTKLREKGYEPHHITIALTFLQEFNYLDDRAYARSFIHDYLLRKPCGKTKIIQELRKRGVSQYDIEDAIAEAFPQEDTLELARAAAEKKLRALRHKSVEKQRSSLTQYLQRQGFHWDIIRAILAEYEADTL